MHSRARTTTMVTPTTIIDRSDRFIRMTELRKTVGLSRSQIYLLINKGSFPKQIKLGDKASGWLLSSIINWMQIRVTESNGEITSTHPATVV